MRTILLVEDDEADAFLFKRAFDDVAKQTGLSLNITHKTNGLEGCDALKAADPSADLPDMVVLDLNMPIMDGLAFLKWLRKQPDLEKVHAAVLTTSTEQTTHAAALSAGADRVFVKPNSLRGMVTVASEILAPPGEAGHGLRG